LDSSINSWIILFCPAEFSGCAKQLPLKLL
jgi:hypothetical protein